MPRAAYSAWRAACCAGRTVQARAPGARATIGTSSTAVTPRADACGAVSGGSVSCWMMPLARQRMFDQTAHPAGPMLNHDRSYAFEGLLLCSTWSPKQGAKQGPPFGNVFTKYVMYVCTYVRSVDHERHTYK